MIYHLYDFDDTIALTRHAIYMSYRKALSEVKKFDLDWEDFGHLYVNANAFMAENGFSNEEIKRVKELKNNFYLSKYWEDVSLLKTANDFNPNEIHIIVTNTTSDVVQTMLRKLDIQDHFTHIIGSDIYLGVNRKPAPDLYNYAFSIFKGKFDPSFDWVIIHEDSKFGLQSALSFYEENKNMIKNFKINYIPQNFN